MEFAQKTDVFLRVLDAIPASPCFGVQYDPVNAITTGDDPVQLLQTVVERMVSMHASDCRLNQAERMCDPKVEQTGPSVEHCIIGEGIVDYDSILRMLSGVGYQGWMSIEDGIDGLAQLQTSVSFLRKAIRANT